MPRRTPIPPAPIRLENEPTPSPNRSRNTTSESVSTSPWPSLVERDRRDRSDRPRRAEEPLDPVDELGSDPAQLVTEQRGVLADRVRARSLRIRDANQEPTSHSAPAPMTVAVFPNASEI